MVIRRGVAHHDNPDPIPLVESHAIPEAGTTPEVFDVPDVGAGSSPVPTQPGMEPFAAGDDGAHGSSCLGGEYLSAGIGVVNVRIDPVIDRAVGQAVGQVGLKKSGGIVNRTDEATV
jgi:hypothetical protein